MVNMSDYFLSIGSNSATVNGSTGGNEIQQYLNTKENVNGE